MDELLTLLNSLEMDIDFEKEKKIITEKKIDSIEMAELLSAIMDHYNVVIPLDVIDAEHFDSIESIWGVLGGLLGTR